MNLLRFYRDYLRDPGLGVLCKHRNPQIFYRKLKCFVLLFGTSNKFEFLTKNKTHNQKRDCGFLFAEGKGFEPLVRPRRTTVFETAPFDHSGNSP